METMAAMFATSATAGSTAAAAGSIGVQTALSPTMLAAAAPTAAAGASGFSAMQLISGVTSAFGALSSVRAGQMQEASLLQEAEVESLRGRQEQVKGLQEGNLIRERLIRTLAQQNAAAGASGVSLNSGSIENAMIQARADAERSLSVVRGDADISSGIRGNNVTRLRAMSGAARLKGDSSAAFGLLDAYDRFSRTGSVPKAA